MKLFFPLKNTSKAFEKWILLQIGALIFDCNFFLKYLVLAVNDPFLIQDFLFVWGVEKDCFCSTNQHELGYVSKNTM